MRERPPPMIEKEGRLDVEFVIPTNGICAVFGIGHKWEPEDERVKVCAYCGAEWWTVSPAQVGRNPEGQDPKGLGAKHEHAVGEADAPKGTQ